MLVGGVVGHAAAAQSGTVVPSSGANQSGAAGRAPDSSQSPSSTRYRRTKNTLVDAFSATDARRRVGVLQPGTRLQIVGSPAPVGFVAAVVSDVKGGEQVVLVAASQIEWAEDDQGARHREHEEEKIEHPLSFGAGLSGYSSKSESHIQVSGELRYLWDKNNESLVGLDLNFGSGPSVGAKVGERYYFFARKSLVPFVHLGLRAFDVRESNSLALDPGLGLQFIHSQGAFVELSAHYLWTTPFNDSRENIWIFGGSSGLRF